MAASDVHVGTAGWAIPLNVRERFAGDGSRLERYARRFRCVEINSSFYRPHRRATYERWAASVGPGFRFAVKVPKEITHVRRLVDCGDVLDRFLDEAAGLGDKRAVLLVQLPPRLAFDAAVAEAFFAALHARTDAALVCEPRNASWFAEDADLLLRAHGVARAAADPAIVPAAAVPGGWRGMTYVRLHGSPQIYTSSYDAARLHDVATMLAAAPAAAWCIFDNTRFGAAIENALALRGA